MRRSGAMGQMKNFQPSDVAKALDLLLHMVGVLSEGNKPAAEDMAQVKELIEQIKQSRN
jgi:hypothetical protein